VSVDLACGELAFVDLTFAQLDALPGPGEERHARDFLRSPGGAAITAIGAARLGLETVLASPIGADAEGGELRAALAAEGVRWAGREVRRTAVTAVLPVDGERAMATFEPGEQVHADELAAVAPRAVVLSLPRLALAPAGAALYATVGDADAQADGAGRSTGLEAARALLVNEREARLLTGDADPREAARRLAERTPCVVVTRGAEGALAVEGGELVEAPGVAVDAVDTTGAGDLFTAAYVWADLRGAPLEARLRWAGLYAALSVRVATGTAGAAHLEELAQAGERHGLGAMPGRPRSVPTSRRVP
jgi:sugar/nucleoside kinase (ribokinase family)